MLYNEVNLYISSWQLRIGKDHGDQDDKNVEKRLNRKQSPNQRLSYKSYELNIVPISIVHSFHSLGKCFKIAQTG